MQETLTTVVMTTTGDESCVEDKTMSGDADLTVRRDFAGFAGEGSVWNGEPRAGASVARTRCCSGACFAAFVRPVTRTRYVAVYSAPFSCLTVNVESRNERSTLDTRRFGGRAPARTRSARGSSSGHIPSL